MLKDQKTPLVGVLRDIEFLVDATTLQKLR
jgi:hypothetical protein